MHSVIPINVSAHRRGHGNERERNILSAILGVLLIATLITALAQPRWFYLKGGGCTREFIGVQQFFFTGNFETITVPPRQGNVSDSLIYYGLNEEIKNCVTPEIVTVQRVIIVLCFLTILCSLSQFYLDILGVTHKWLKFIRRNGIGSVLSVIVIIIVIWLCYYSSKLMQEQQETTKIYPTRKVEIKFAMSYYLVTTAGVIAILAAASNLFRRYPMSGNHDIQGLLDDDQDEETFSIALPHSRSWAHFHGQNDAYIEDIPPPPPYTP